MKKEIEIKVPPSRISDEEWIRARIGEKLRLKSNEPFFYNVIRRSIDARKRKVFLYLGLKSSMKNQDIQRVSI